jgi:alcohol dehydrogenase class IV
MVIALGGGSAIGAAAAFFLLVEDRDDIGPAEGIWTYKLALQ